MMKTCNIISFLYGVVVVKAISFFHHAATFIHRCTHCFEDVRIAFIEHLHFVLRRNKFVNFIEKRREHHESLE